MSGEKRELQVLVLFSLMYYSTAQSTCEDCCPIAKALLGPLIAALCQQITTIPACIYIVVKKLGEGARLDAKLVGVVNVLLAIAIIVWFIITTVDVDCECCQDDRVGVIVLLSLECVVIVQGIIFNIYLNYKYQFWRHWCGCGRTQQSHSLNERQKI